jgi:nicotinamidase-related amidase
LVIDIIKDFVSGVLGSDRARSVVPRVKGFLEEARRRGVPIIHITDAHIEGDREFELWPRHAVDGTEGAEIVEELQPKRGDYHLKKRRYSAFYATGLDALLRGLGVDTVILTGLVTNICVQHTAADAFFRGYRVIVLEDCVEAPSEEAHRSALRYMEEIYGAEVTGFEELLKRLEG